MREGPKTKREREREEGGGGETDLSLRSSRWRARCWRSLCISFCTCSFPMRSWVVFSQLATAVATKSLSTRSWYALRVSSSLRRCWIRASAAMRGRLPPLPNMSLCSLLCVCEGSKRDGRNAMRERREAP